MLVFQKYTKPQTQSSLFYLLHSTEFAFQKHSQLSSHNITPEPPCNEVPILHPLASRRPEPRPGRLGSPEPAAGVGRRGGRPPPRPRRAQEAAAAAASACGSGVVSRRVCARRLRRSRPDRAGPRPENFRRK